MNDVLAAAADVFHNSSPGESAELENTVGNSTNTYVHTNKDYFKKRPLSRCCAPALPRFPVVPSPIPAVHSPVEAATVSPCFLGWHWLLPLFLGSSRRTPIPSLSIVAAAVQMQGDFGGQGSLEESSPRCITKLEVNGTNCMLIIR